LDSTCRFLYAAPPPDINPIWTGCDCGHIKFCQKICDNNIFGNFGFFIVYCNVTIVDIYWWRAWLWHRQNNSLKLAIFYYFSRNARVCGVFIFLFVV